MISRSVSASFTAARSRASDSDDAAHAINRFRSLLVVDLGALRIHRADRPLRPPHRLAVGVAASSGGRPTRASRGRGVAEVGAVVGDEPLGVPEVGQVQRACLGAERLTHEIIAVHRGPLTAGNC